MTLDYALTLWSFSFGIAIFPVAQDEIVEQRNTAAKWNSYADAQTSGSRLAFEHDLQFF